MNNYPDGVYSGVTPPWLLPDPEPEPLHYCFICGLELFEGDLAFEDQGDYFCSTTCRDELDWDGTEPLEQTKVK